VILYKTFIKKIKFSKNNTNLLRSKNKNINFYLKILDKSLDWQKKNIKAK